MESLIKITTNEQGSSVVSARELYQYLGYNTSQWKRWYEKNISKNEFAIENFDYQTLDIMSNGNATKDFALTIDFATKLSMMAKTEKGEEVRDFFIALKKNYQPKTLSPAEQLLANAQLLVDIERKQKETDERISKTEQAVLMLEAKAQTRSNYFTIVGYATLNGISCGIKVASSLGKKASALCNQRNIPTESLPDPRFGIVKTYPIPILEEVFSMNLV